MPKQGEMTFLGKIGELGLRHALNKPFSDPNGYEALGEISTILRLLPKPPLSLMDMGCGTGWTSVWFARWGYHVLGIDISQEMIDAAQDFAAAEELPNLQFLTSDYENLTISEEFDCAVFFHSLHHAEDERAALTSVYRALKPGGVCVTCEPGDGHAAAEGSLQAVEQFGTTEKDMPPRHIIRLAKEVGFRRCHAFPLLTANFVKDYVWSGVEQAPPTPPRARRTGLGLMLRKPLRLLSHWIARVTLGINPNELSRYRECSQKWTRIDGQGDGFAVLVK